MISEEMLKELGRFLKLEIEGKNNYENILKKIRDKEIRKALLHFRDEEMKHINLLKKTIEDVRL